MKKDSDEIKGLIYSIQKFAVHDGPGIRTLIYMKGCPLSCVWCSSPQSQKPEPEIIYYEVRCKKCGSCIEACPVKAISMTEDGIKIDRVICNGCGECAEICQNQALEFAGREVTVAELFGEINKDSGFFRRSGGGITVGGGEPTMQPEFVAEFLKRCKQNNIHTAIETCGFVSWENLEKILNYVDLVYMDIKHMDSAVHEKLTSVPNTLILENIRKASALHTMIIRIPVVPGYNDSDDNIIATVKFASQLGANLLRVELLPYHKFGSQTYGRIGREYELQHVEPPDDARMESLKKMAESCGIKVQIGG